LTLDILEAARWLSGYSLVCCIKVTIQTDAKRMLQRHCEKKEAQGKILLQAVDFYAGIKWVTRAFSNAVFFDCLVSPFGINLHCSPQCRIAKLSFRGYLTIYPLNFGFLRCLIRNHLMHPMKIHSIGCLLIVDQMLVIFTGKLGDVQ
jgi:hypothetical protein